MRDTRRKTPEELALIGSDKKNKARYEGRMDSSLVRFDKNVLSLEPPKYLGKRAKEAWQDTLPGLLRLGVLGPLDMGLLEEGFVQLDNCYKMADKMMALDKENKDNDLIDYLDVREKLRRSHSQSLNDALKILSQFGVTPVARTRLVNVDAMEAKKEKDPLDIVLG